MSGTAAQGLGIVKVQLSGRGPDLIKVATFLESVTSGGNPDAVFRARRLDAIEIMSERASTGRGRWITLTLQIKESAR